VHRPVRFPRTRLAGTPLVGWLVGWLVCWLVGWLAGWLAGMPLTTYGVHCSPEEEVALLVEGGVCHVWTLGAKPPHEVLGLVRGGRVRPTAVHVKHLDGRPLSLLRLCHVSGCGGNNSINFQKKIEIGTTNQPPAPPPRYSFGNNPKRFLKIAVAVFKGILKASFCGRLIITQLFQVWGISQSFFRSQDLHCII